MRIVRPGSVVGPQQQYMYLKQLEWTKWAVADEMRKAQRDQTIAVTTVVAPVTPPAEVEEDTEMQTDMIENIVPTSIEHPSTPPPLSLPPVTPNRHVASTHAAAVRHGAVRMACARRRFCHPPGVDAHCRCRNDQHAQAQQGLTSDTRQGRVPWGYLRGRSPRQTRAGDQHSLKMTFLTHPWR